MTPPLTLSGIQDAQITLASDAAQRRDQALAGCRSITTVIDALDEAVATDALKTASDLLKQIETYRVAAKAPVLELAHRIDALAKEFTAELVPEKTRLSLVLGAYQKAELEKAESARRAAALEADRSAAVAIEAAKRAQSEADLAATGPEAERAQEAAAQAAVKAEETIIAGRQAVAQAAATAPKGTSVRAPWKFEVLDLDALYRARPDLCVIEPNSSLIRETIKVNQSIPGLRIWQEAKASTR